MNKNRIRLSESQLHRVIKESVKKVISEVDWKKLDSAVGKSEYLNSGAGNAEDVLEAVSVIDDYLANFITNSDTEYNSENIGVTGFSGAYNPNHQAVKLRNDLNRIYKFIVRKQKQLNNLNNHLDNRFRSEHDGLSQDEYSDSIYDKYGTGTPSDNNLTDKEREFVNYKW